MYFFKLFIISILPGILWVWYYYKKDKYDPEPARLILRDFFLGIILVIPAGLLEAPFASFLTPQTPVLLLFLASILIIGVIEEGLKSYIVYKYHYEHPEFDEPIDGIIYGVTVGLGFAASENLFYTVLYGYQVGLVRAVLTSLAHASFTGIFGFYLARAHHEKNKSFIWSGFLLVAFFHGLYDFLVIGGFINIFLAIVVIGLLQIYLASLIKTSSNRSPFK
ncbi:MAG: PrsW family intramembrane metalloprotease [Halanaerobiaceae bacterium]|nr:PrsW family intramembrane metalloprotease [Halanaerobiaceae bacterium]